MSNYLQSDANEPSKADLMVVRDKTRINDFMDWTTKKFRCSKQQLLERVAPQKVSKSVDPAFEQLSAEFDRDRLAYERYVSLLKEYSLQIEALADLEKELSAIFGELVPLEIRGLSAQPVRRPSNQLDNNTGSSKHPNQGVKNIDDGSSPSASVANLDSTKLNLGEITNQALRKRRANAIRASLYVRAVDCADERLSTVASVAMTDTTNSFARANEARLEFDAARTASSSQNSIAVARDHYERAKQDSTVKLELLNAHKIRSVERVLAVMNTSSCCFYAAQRDALCSLLRNFSVSVPADLNTLLTERSLLSGASGQSPESNSVVNVRSLSRSVSMGALQVKTYTRRVKGYIASAKASSTNQQVQPAQK